MIYAPLVTPKRNRRRRARPVAPTFTEAEIRTALDGTFTRVFGWRETVPLDFIPRHENIHILAASTRWRFRGAR